MNVKQTALANISPEEVARTFLPHAIDATIGFSSFLSEKPFSCVRIKSGYPAISALFVFLEDV